MQVIDSWYYEPITLWCKFFHSAMYQKSGWSHSFFFLISLCWDLIPNRIHSSVWRKCIECVSCWSLSAKEPLITGLFCGRWPIKIRHPMVLCYPAVSRLMCPTTSIMYVHSLVARFQNFSWCSLQINQSCAEDQMLKDLMFRTRLCGAILIIHFGWLIYFR